MQLLVILLSSLIQADGWIYPAAKRYGINPNRFEKCPSSAEPQRTPEGNIVWCSNSTDCPEHHTCTAIQGLTHFGVQINYCCPTRMSVCQLPPQPGYGECGKKPRRMYYFDSTRLRCQAFKVLECLGTNDNRFNTIEECATQCERTACKAGESLLMEGNGPKLCGTEDCPQNYICRYDALFRRHVCCGYSNRGACAVGYRSYMNAGSGLPQKCNINYVRDECPTDFLCTSSADSVDNFCCSLENGVCPMGQTPYYHPLTSKTVKCNPLSEISDCPSEYTCSAAVAGAIWGFCCSQQVTAQCPRGSVPFINPLTDQPEKCTVGVSICRKGFECKHKNTKLLIGFCCSVSKNPKAPKSPTVGSRVSSFFKRNNTNTDKRTNRRVVHKYRLSTAPPFLYNTKQLRIVDIQKEVDRQNAELDKKLKSVLSYGRGRFDELRCPSIHREPFYENEPTIECHLFKKCPEGLECVSPQDGYMSKSICCGPLDSDENKYIAQTSSLTQPQLSTTSDPFCPIVIENRQCEPGDVTFCSEAGFFCQFNVIRQAFMCCSMTKNFFTVADLPEMSFDRSHYNTMGH